VARHQERAMTVARENIDALTGLRFVAAFLITFGHSWAPALDITAIGMPLFFTLSGFIIHYVYSEAFQGRWSRATGQFAFARFSRLYPLYWFLMIYFMLRTAMGAMLAHPDNFPALLGYLFACWTWWPALADGKPVWFYFISWSVSTEIFFYVCYALFLYRLAAIRSVRSCLWALVAFCLLAYAFFFALFITRDIWEPAVLQGHPEFISRVDDFEMSFYRWFLYLSPYCRLPEFIGGVLTCQLFRLSRQQHSIVDRVRPATVGIVAIAVMAVLYAQLRYFGENDPWKAVGHFTYGAFVVNLHQNFLFAPCCYAVMFSLACGGWGLARALSSGPARFLGDISYSTYLSHQRLTWWLEEHFALSQQLPTLLYLALLLPAIYLLSWGLYTVVEMPAKRVLRGLVSTRTERRSTVSTGG